LKAPTLDSQLCFALYSASSHVSGIYRSLLDDIGITYPQFLVLLSLWEEDNVSISYLSERTTLSKSTLTPLLKLLEKKKLIIRKSGEVDERQKTIQLTTTGKRLSEKARGVTDAAFCETGLSKAEAKQIIQLCQRVTHRGVDKTG